MPFEPLMSSRWTAPAPSPSASFLIAAVATALCCLCALWAFGGVFRKADAIKNKKSSCKCVCSCDGGGDSGTARANGEMAICGEKRTATAERQVGGSMMEQLVPEITTHVLSYLDYTSLCRLSMTNSAMRRAANDDGAWKALYHKLSCRTSQWNRTASPQLMDGSLIMLLPRPLLMSMQSFTTSLEKDLYQQ